MGNGPLAAISGYQQGREWDQPGAPTINNYLHKHPTHQHGLQDPCIYVKQLGKEKAGLALTKG